MTAPKLRIIAGPNGSGKTTLFEFLRSEFRFSFGHVLNPDDLDDRLSNSGRVNLVAWGIETTTEELHAWMRDHPAAGDSPKHWPRVEGGFLLAPGGFKSTYLTVALADFVRDRWLRTNQSFTFETVMSHPSKVSLVERALHAGFRTYLYYVCTELPVINVERVSGRVATGGHEVPEDKIVTRYQRSLDLLPKAIRVSSRAFVFDNSGTAHRFTAEFQVGKLIRVQEPLPNWFVASVLQELGLADG